jgi:glycosyltransferase involved in cell wall biosynthesis
MKVIILFNESIHFGLAAASRVSYYAKGLEENGTETTIVMPFSFLAKENIYFEQRGIFNDAKYIYLSFLNYHPKKKYPFPLNGIVLYFNRWLGYLKYLSYFINNRSNYDVVYVYRFSTFFTLLIQLFNFKKVVVSELCEIPYQSDVGLKQKINRFIREKTVFKLFDAYVVISETLQEYIKIHKSKKAKLIKIPILTEKFDVDNIYSKSEFPYMVHAGSITEKKDGIVGMIKAFAVAVKSIPFPVKFIITGYLESSPDKIEIKKCIQDNNLAAFINFVGFITKEELQLLQSKSVLAILNKHENEQNNYCFPTKLAEYLSNGIVVIATTVGELKNYLIDGKNAYLIPPGNIELMAQKIIAVFTNEEESLRISKSGKELADLQFNYKIQCKRLNTFFQQIK